MSEPDATRIRRLTVPPPPWHPARSLFDRMRAAPSGSAERRNLRRALLRTLDDEEHVMHTLIAQYGDPLRLVDDTPRTVSDIYWQWTEATPHPLSRRKRGERRWLAMHLELAAYRQKVVRSEQDGRFYFTKGRA